MTDKLDKPIGTKQSSALSPIPVQVVSVAVEPVKKKSGEVVGDKVVLSVAHAEADDLVALSSVQYLNKKSIKQAALWYSEDSDGNIAKNSALASAMQFYKCNTIRDFTEKILSTELDDNGYLIIRAY